MKNDYTELRKIYEGYGGQSMNYGPNTQYAPNDASANLTFGKGRLPAAYPGMGGQYSAYEYNLNSNNITASAEMEEVPEKNIKNYVVLDKIDEYIEQAQEDEMIYAVHSLGQLKEYIKSL